MVKVVPDWIIAAQFWLKWGGIAISAKSLQGWTRAQANEAIGDARVIYVYHDVIDAIGDKQATEQQTFSAVRQAIDELNNLVSKIINGFGVTRVIVTADHGFLFQREAPESGVKAQLQTEPSGTLEAKKRYLIGRQLPVNEDVWQGRICDTVGGDSDVGFWLPKGGKPFPLCGRCPFCAWRGHVAGDLCAGDGSAGASRQKAGAA
ncbi:PglZ domain-containing protein [Aeromonas veronii]|uniref:PglZ domain-containing protein n=1 Tax=Aeromonas veronii TaxID=654 RepID=UPI003DA66DFA